MIIPAVMFIEMAIDMMKGKDQADFESELHEFRSLGNRLDAVKFPEGTTDAEKGYIIGLETARVLLLTNAGAVQHDIMI